MLVADADMLTDNAAVEIQDVFGQRVVVPRNGNLNFAQSSATSSRVTPARMPPASGGVQTVPRSIQKRLR